MPDTNSILGNGIRIATCILYLQHSGLWDFFRIASQFPGQIGAGNRSICRRSICSEADGPVSNTGGRNLRAAADISISAGMTTRYQATVLDWSPSGVITWRLFDRSSTPVHQEAVKTPLINIDISRLNESEESRLGTNISNLVGVHNPAKCVSSAMR